jgi:hypothetical protein
MTQYISKLYHGAHMWLRTTAHGAAEHTARHNARPAHPSVLSEQASAALSGVHQLASQPAHLAFSHRHCDGLCRSHRLMPQTIDEYSARSRFQGSSEAREYCLWLNRVGRCRAGDATHDIGVEFVKPPRIRPWAEQCWMERSSGGIA